MDDIEQTLPRRLARLSAHMREVAHMMVATEHPECRSHGEQLIGAADVAASWIEPVRQRVCMGGGYDLSNDTEK
jgi:hypothetical protein